MKLSIIAAVANNSVIGNENRLIWHMPADLKRFKNATMGHTLIMGRKTFQSIGKPLPGRKTIVITRQTELDTQGCPTATSFKEAINLVKDEKEVFVAGGAEIYEQAMESYYTKKIILTRIFAEFEGDAFFPDIDPKKWELIEREDYEADKKHPYPFSFMVYKRKNNNIPKTL